MPKVTAYHPSLRVTVGDQERVIEADLDDWYPDDQVLDLLQEAYGVKGSDELVRAIESQELPPSSAVRAVRMV